MGIKIKLTTGSGDKMQKIKIMETRLIITYLHTLYSILNT